MASPDPADTFIARWQDVTASELATAQSFVIDLCVSSSRGVAVHNRLHQ